MICLVDGCARNTIARAMCSLHYQRAKTKGIIPHKSCLVIGCKKVADSNNLCPMHRRRKKLYGDPGEPAHRHEKHGMRWTRTYRIWLNMKSRCDNPNATSYRHYGARGITYCKQWKAFSSFLRDMGEAPPKLELDRIDNSKGYSKGNCHWVSKQRNLQNTRRTVFVDYGGKKMCLSEYMRLTGQPYRRARISLGLD